MPRGTLRRRVAPGGPCLFRLRVLFCVHYALLRSLVLRQPTRYPNTFGSFRPCPHRTDGDTGSDLSPSRAEPSAGRARRPCQSMVVNVRYAGDIPQGTCGRRSRTSHRAGSVIGCDTTRRRAAGPSTRSRSGAQRHKEMCHQGESRVSTNAKPREEENSPARYPGRRCGGIPGKGQELVPGPRSRYSAWGDPVDRQRVPTMNRRVGRGKHQVPDIPRTATRPFLAAQTSIDQGP